MDRNKFSNRSSVREQNANRFVSRNRNGAKAFSKKPDCTQFSEIDVGDDIFVLDVLQFFFDERLEANQINDELREIAARAVWKATEGSEAMDMVPRPPRGVPSPKWVVSEAVQIAFRRAQNRCLYEAVRRTVKLSMRSAYEVANNGIMSQSLDVPPRIASWQMSRVGLQMLKQFEGFRSQLYNDAAGHCTIGYGHLVHHGNCNGSESAEFQTGITEARGEELLCQRLQAFERAVNNAVTVRLNAQQFDALVSFAFNIGVGAFQNSTLLRKLNTSDYVAVPMEMNKWVNAGGRRLAGLVTRRQTESTLFRDGIYPGTSGSQSWSIDLSDLEAPYVRDFQAQVDWCQIRHSIIRSAVEIQGDWLVSGTNNLKNEGDQSVRDMLEMFWRDGVGMSQQQATATAQLSAQDHPTQAYWSAAFISWCVRNAFPDPPPPNNGGFHFHSRHMAYIAQALRNRENGDMARPFWLYDINDPNVVPEDGDILCLNRNRLNQGWTRHSYTSIRHDWFENNPAAVATGSAHCDIVISSENGRVETIGGNVGDTVGSRYYSLDTNGRLVNQTLFNGSTTNNGQNVTQTVGNRPPLVFALIRLQDCPNFEN